VFYLVAKYKYQFFVKKAIQKREYIFNNLERYFKRVSDCCLMPPQQLFSYIMARTSYFSMRWWWGSLCTRYFEKGSHQQGVRTFTLFTL